MIKFRETPIDQAQLEGAYEPLRTKLPTHMLTLRRVRSNMMFPGLTSRCMIPRECTKSRAYANDICSRKFPQPSQMGTL